MRILMVSWEYPPLVVGGLAAHVHGLATAYARAGHECVVLTRVHPYVPDDAQADGVRVLRAHTDLPWVPPDNFLAQVVSANHQIAQLAEHLGRWRPDVVHAHDWLSAWAGDTLQSVYRRPLVATVHATELGRQQWHLPNPTSEGINAAEWWLTYQAKRVICCSGFMVDEVTRAFQLPREKVDLVPNGVDPSRFALGPGQHVERGERGPLVVSWGRLEYEKGFQTLLGALARLDGTVPGLRAVLVGRGTYADALRAQAHAAGLSDMVAFAGFVADEELVRLLHEASCAVIPSLYEPFGIVALEALAAGAPLAAADSGGLHEILAGTGAALLCPAGDADALAGAIHRLVTDAALARACRDRGDALVRDRYSWDAIAERTLATYEGAGARPH